LNIGVPVSGVKIEDLEKVRTGTATLYVYGKCTYKDQFGNSHKTRFCTYYSPTGKGWTHCPEYSEND
jgi:hypothetical protein